MVDSQYENYQDYNGATNCVDECATLRRPAIFVDGALKKYIAEEGKYSECHRGRCTMYVWDWRVVPVAIAREESNAQCGYRRDLAENHLQMRVPIIGEEKCGDRKQKADENDV